MKKHILGIIAASSALSAFAQLPVNTAPENKKIVLEEFTGIYCGYCPDGHSIANGIYNSDPDNVVLINIHSGGYANVSTGEPDLKTAVGTAIDGMGGMGISGYPAGDVNRKVFSGTTMSGGRGNWTGWANTIKTQPAYCNVAMEGRLDVMTRVLTATVQVYYTSASPVATNSLNIFLLEDGVNGPQHNYGNPYYNLANYNPDGSYNHNHVLRKALTPNFGMTIPQTSSGTTFTTVVSYTVPMTYGANGKTNPCNLGNLKLAAFVTETSVNTINANHGPIKLTGFESTVDAGIFSVKPDNSVCGAATMNASFKFTNFGSDTITDAEFSYGIDNTTLGTYIWSGSLSPMTTSQAVDLPAISFNALATNSLVVKTVNVNNVADQNPGNNLGLKQVPYAAFANSLNLAFNFTQDAYGSESTWYIVDEVSTNTILSGGPYADLSGSGTVVHTDTFVIDPASCYRLVVEDASEDGINSGYGGGGYTLKAIGSTTSILSSNGQYGAGETRLFTTNAAATNTTILITGISSAALNISSVKVYPNPAKDVANLSVNLSQNETLSISVLSSTGQEVYSVRANSMAAGENNIALDTQNWANGVYFIRIATAKGSVNQKLIITK